jgi:hypothetical protein
MAGVVGSGGSLAAVGVEVVAVQVGDAEGQVQGLAAVEAGIACRLVAVAQVALGDVVAAAGALGDVGAPPTFRTADPLGSSAGKDQNCQEKSRIIPRNSALKPPAW